jgi:hypothetical protein
MMDSELRAEREQVLFLAEAALIQTEASLVMRLYQMAAAGEGPERALIVPAEQALLG